MATLESIFAYYGDWYDQIFTYVFPGAFIFSVITIIKYLKHVYDVKLQSETLDVHDFKKVMYTGLVSGLVLCAIGGALYYFTQSGISVIVIGGMAISLFFGGIWAQIGLAPDELPAYTKMFFGASILTIIGVIVLIVMLIQNGDSDSAKQYGIMFLLPAIGCAVASYWAYGRDA